MVPIIGKVEFALEILEIAGRWGLLLLEKVAGWILLFRSIFTLMVTNFFCFKCDCQRKFNLSYSNIQQTVKQKGEI